MRLVARALVVLAMAASGACAGDDAAADAQVADGGGVDVALAGDAAGPDGSADAASPDAAPLPPPGVAWAVRFGGSAAENPLGVAVDPGDDVYVAGVSFGSFDAGDVHLDYAGGNGDGFVMRLDHGDGHVVWARPWSGAGQDWVRGIAIAPDGAVVLLGQTSGAIDLGAGPITSGSTMVLAALEASDGAVRWTRTLPGPGYVGTGHLAVHGDGTLCASGDLAGASDFGDGPIASPHDPTSLVACFDADGTYRWARLVDEPAPGAAMGLALTSEGDLLTSVVSNVSGHGYVGRFAAAGGDSRWESELTASTALSLRAVATDAQDRAYAGGTLSGSMDFAGTTHSASGAPVVLAYEPDGTPRAVFVLGGDGSGAYNALATAPDGTLVAAGVAKGTIVAGDTTHVITGANAAFVVAFAPDGAPRWSRSFADEQGAAVTAVAVDGAGAIVVAGAFDGSGDFGGTTLTSAGSGDIFVARLVP